MILKQFDLHVYRSILCLNGHLPDASFFSTVPLPIIAADGAANQLYELGITPAVVVGDLDGISDEVRRINKTVFEPDQNSCDFDKSLAYAKQHDLLPSIILGMNGGYLDHILNNMSIFLETDNLLYAPPIVGLVINQQNTKSLVLPINTKISFFGIPQASVTSKGLKWELNEMQLNFPGKNSCFNRTTNEKIEIKVQAGRVLALIYTEQIMDAGNAVSYKNLNNQAS